VCHAPDASGSPRGPDLRSRGSALVDFVVSTGRMPLASPTERERRHAVRYSAAEVRALVGYASTLVRGPAVPTVDLAGVDLAAGGAVFRSQCAACHQAAGGGGALAHGAEAPPLLAATPVQVVEAMRTGPGNMPAFDDRTISPKQADQVAAYVRYLQHPKDPGGLDLGHLGPVPEGLVAWSVGLVALLVVARLLGTRVGQGP
jgi:ubiquinol-cytochrome c reductase cytochrome c subunit